jgi:hypothetical protein
MRINTFALQQRETRTHMLIGHQVLPDALEDAARGFRPNHLRDLARFNVQQRAGWSRTVV